MRLPAVPDPRDLVGLIPRAVTLLGDAEQLVRDVRGLVNRIEDTRRAADDVVARAAATAARADRLVLLVEEPLIRLVPLLEQVAEEADPALVAPLRAVAESLPGVLTSWQEQAVPLLDKLGSVAPDLHDLLSASQDLNEMLGHLPGMGRARKKVEESQDDDKGQPEPPR
jgi:hypothetical protein